MTATDPHARMRRESRLRSRARTRGIAVHKDRARSWSIDHHGGYMLVDIDRKVVIAGEQFNLDLNGVEECLTD